jgi:thiosulfate/3-mercaptopyruvate sulfurtransferase
MDNNALVDCEWLDQHDDNPDVRIIEINRVGTEVYDGGHIPGAIGVNWKEFLWDPYMRAFPSPELFSERMASLGLNNDSIIVVYGDPVQFGTYGWWVLKYCGHRDVRLLNGGRLRWQAEGRSLVKDRPVISEADYSISVPVSQMRASRNDVLAALDRDDTLLLDHRSPEEYLGELVSPPGEPDVGAERYGRIPGAKHLYFREFLNETDDTFRSKDEIMKILESRDITAGDQIICYCRLSHRATLAYFVFTELLGFKNVRSYDGSWTEWGSIVGFPIER